MSETVIKVENLTKFYQLGLINHGTLAKDLQGWWAKFHGRDDPNSRISLTSSQNNDKNTDFIYALKDVSFDVQRGEVLGIIGANGAGKSTLLKILSRVTSPTSGCIKIKGRIGSLLEVGTGFHPELTGRENIYLNGAILGMRKNEIDKKLDEIIDFSGVEKFIDTPVKRYSSGMYVRLAFAVAAHLDPEILVVDEVLAVGDADFQKKCLGKMDDVSRKEGRTILFVSHNMGAVRQLCTRGILLKNGEVLFNGKIEEAIDRYFPIDKTRAQTDLFTRIENREGNFLAKFVKFEIFSSGKLTNIIKINDNISFKMTISSIENIADISAFLVIETTLGIKLIHTNSFLSTGKRTTLTKGKNIFTVSFNSMPLKPGKYFINIGIWTREGAVDSVPRAASFEVQENNAFKANMSSCEVVLPNQWDIVKEFND